MKHFSNTLVFILLNYILELMTCACLCVRVCVCVLNVYMYKCVYLYISMW